MGRRVIAMMTSFRAVSGATQATSSPVCIAAATLRRRFRPELASGVKSAELLGGEIAGANQGDGERVSERQGCHGAGRGRQVVGIGFALDRGVQPDIHLRGERRCQIAQDADQRRAKLAQQGHQRLEFGGRAVVGEQHGGVARRVDSEVAVYGFGRMQEDRGGAGAAQRCDDLSGDVAALADAGYDDLAGMLRGSTPRRESVRHPAWRRRGGWIPIRFPWQRAQRRAKRSRGRNSWDERERASMIA